MDFKCTKTTNLFNQIIQLNSGSKLSSNYFKTIRKNFENI